MKNQSLRLSWLLFANYFFYATWNIKFCAILATLTIIEYLTGLFLSKNIDQKMRKFLYISNIALTLILFCSLKFFKTKFFPIGLSFYYLQGISYVTDVYKKTLKEEKNFFHFALYLSFFPQILSGPISRAGDMLKQFKQKMNFKEIDWNSAITEFTMGLFKKAYCADYLAQAVVDPIFKTPASYSKSCIFMAVMAYTIQIYCDFSGYSNMARGVARMFGIQLMANFNYPLLSGSFVEFWTRWHISLSQWLRDYIYFPLLKSWGKIATPFILFLASMITWIIAGIWHGTGFNYFYYGVFQGVLVGGTTVYKLKKMQAMKKAGTKKRPQSFHFVGFVFTFFLFNVSMILFKTKSLLDFFHIIRLVLTSTGEVNLFSLHAALIFLFVFAENISGYFKLNEKYAFPETPVAFFLKGSFIGLVLVYIFLVAPKNYVSFIYFQF